jgi:magnesium transporter
MDNVVMTLQEKSYKIFSLVRERITKRVGRIRIKGTAFLVFRLLNSMIDHYSVEMEALEVKVVALETDDDDTDVLSKVGELKRQLYETKRRVSPVKSVVAQLEKIEEFVGMDDIRHFNELKHHAADVMDSVDECRQVLDGIVNLYYAKQGQRMNEVMKVLTLISTIFIPLTFIAGLYGMNFKFMPELNSPFGYPVVLVVMFGIAIVLYRWFRGKGWLD